MRINVTQDNIDRTCPAAQYGRGASCKHVRAAYATGLIDAAALGETLEEIKGAATVAANEATTGAGGC